MSNSGSNKIKHELSLFQYFFCSDDPRLDVFVILTGLPAFPISRQVDENENVKASEYDEHIDHWVVTTKNNWNNDTPSSTGFFLTKSLFCGVSSEKIETVLSFFVMEEFWKEK